VCEWDSAGYQASVGNAGPWRGVQRSTRLIVTGVGDDHTRLAATFRDVLLNDREMVAGLNHWVRRPDGF
jgi:hypothetical protein